MQTARASEERLPRTTLLLQMQNQRSHTSKMSSEETGQPATERCKSDQGTSERHENCREDWKRAQDQLQFSNPDNSCLNCTDNHRTQDCLMRQQHQAPPINNPVNGQGIYNYSPQHFTQQSSQQHSQQSQSTVGSCIPMLMINNPQYQGFQGQPQRQQTPLVPQVKQQIRSPTPQTFNQQYNQYQVPQSSQLLAQQQHHSQIPSPYSGQWQYLVKYYINKENISSLCRQRKKPAKNAKSRGGREKRDGKKTTTQKFTQTRHLRR